MTLVTLDLLDTLDTLDLLDTLVTLDLLDTLDTPRRNPVKYCSRLDPLDPLFVVEDEAVDLFHQLQYTQASVEQKSAFKKNLKAS